MKKSLRIRFDLSRWLVLLLVIALSVAALPAAITRAKRGVVAPLVSAAQNASCATICLRGPQYYLTNLDRLPGGAVLIPGVNLNALVSTGNETALRLALRGGDSAAQRFNQHFVAAQLALLHAPGTDQAALQSRLSCYGLDFAPVRLSSGFSVRTSTTLGELLEQARSAAREGRTQDFADLADFLDSLNSDDPLGRCGVDSTSLRVVDLSPNPTQAELVAARRAFLRGHVVRMIGGLAEQLRQLLGVQTAGARANEARLGTTPPTAASKLQVVAVRATASGALHEFHGFVSGLNGSDANSWQASFAGWLEHERRSPHQAKLARTSLTSAESPSKGAWTELHEVTFSNGTTGGKFSIPVTVYRLNDINREKDWYLVAQAPEVTPNVEQCGVSFFTPCRWVTSKRTFTLESEHEIYEHEPLNEITKTEAGFEIGGSLGSEGPGLDAGFEFSWEQLSVTTHDLTTKDGAKTAKWQEDFTLRSNSRIPVTSTDLFVSHQAVIYEVPEGTTHFDVTLQATFEFVEQTPFDNVDDTSRIDFQAKIPIFAPVLAVAPDTLVIPPGGQGTILVTAGIPESDQGISWKANTNQVWLTVDSPNADFSGTESVTVTVAPGTAPGTPGGVVTIDTDPPYAAPSVVSGPLRVNIVVGQPTPPAAGVLLVGGETLGGVAAVAEIYDPATKTVTTVGALNTPRTEHVATALPDGTVLITGGKTGSHQVTATAELYQPATGMFVPVKGARSCQPHPGVGQPGCMTESRTHHTATLLSNGKVLIAGGYTEGGEATPVATAELYDPATQTFTPTGSLTDDRAEHAAILLADGKVLIVGGKGDPDRDGFFLRRTADVYDPASGKFTSFPMDFYQSGAGLYFSYDDVEAVGGEQNEGSGKKVQRLVRSSGTWQEFGSLNQEREGHQVTQIGNHIGLVTGGATFNSTPAQVRATIEQKDEPNLSWRLIGTNCPGGVGCLLSPRVYHTATNVSTPPAPTGGTLVLIAGGQDGNFRELGTTELYDTFTGVSVAGPTIIARSHHTATLFRAQPAATTTALSASINPSTYNQSVTFTAKVSAASGTPTGMVTFKDGGTTLGGASLSGGSAIYTTSSLAVGAHSITAVYEGGASFAPSTSLALTQTVNKAATTTTLASSANPATPGQAVTFTAQVTSSAAGSPTGTVTFRDGATVLGTAALGGGMATLTKSDLAQGTHTISASYEGDANYAASASPGLTQTINPPAKAATTTTLTSDQNPSSFGYVLKLTATVSSNAGGTPPGGVTFSAGQTVLGAQPLNGGTATLLYGGFDVGTHSITAVYSGDANFAGSTSPALSQVVNKAATTTTLSSSANPATGGQEVVLTANVRAVTGPIPQAQEGTITFLDGTTTLGTAQIVNGRATLRISTLTPGTHIITAAYSGAAHFLASTSDQLRQVINTGSVPSFSPTVQ